MQLKKFNITNIEELEIVSNYIIKEILPLHKIISFEGDLGAGKTTLISNIIQSLGETETSSPTYTLVNEYDTSLGRVYHFDFYRLKTQEEALDFGWLEYLDSRNICMLEWASKILDYMPETYIKVEIELNTSGSRVFRVLHQGI